MMFMAASRIRSRVQLDIHFEYLILKKHMRNVALGALYVHRSGVGSTLLGILFLVVQSTMTHL